MRASPIHRPHRRAAARRAATGVAACVLILLPAAPALAHDEGESTQSRVLALAALTYLANRPAGFEDVVKDKLHDAADASDTDGVDLTQVAAAQQAFDNGDLAATRTLLQKAVQPLTTPVTGEETGTTVMLDPAAGQVSLGGLDGVLAGLSVLAVIAGGVAAVRTRPTDSIQGLKAQLTGGAS